MHVTICDVGPRDGLQNEPETLAPAVRAELVSRLAAAGVPRIEAVSFVRDDRVPQMAGAEEIVLSDPGVGVYKKLVIANDRLIGAVLFGDTTDVLWYLDLIRSGSPIEHLRDDLVFGRALATRAAA